MADLSLEKVLWADGVDYVVGVDEAGRGPLAGSVSVGAVVLPRDYAHAVLDDSKKLTEKRREAVYADLLADARVVWAQCDAGVEEIEEKNILGATHAAMRRAVAHVVEKLGLGEAELDRVACLVDGLRVPEFPYAHEGVVKGDSKSLSIAAASVIAKVTRDRQMVAYEEEYPGYGFAKHKGYGTKAHLAALRELGPCAIHRRGFAPVAQMSLDLS